MLNVFQTDLGNISREIKNLQERSTEINIKLKNRKVGIRWIDLYSRVYSIFLTMIAIQVVEARLGHILDNVVVAPHMIRYVTRHSRVSAIFGVANSVCALQKNCRERGGRSMAPVSIGIEQADAVCESQSEQAYPSFTRHWPGIGEIALKGRHSC